jgi:hypothetical protein
MKAPFFLSALLFALLLAPLLPPGLSAAEYTNGGIRLVLHESTGRFSLYYLTDPSAARYEPFFVDQDPRTSFLTVIIDDKTYRLGETSAFRFRSGGTAENPALIFESSFLRVTEEFTFIKTAGSASANGVKLHIRIENTGPREIQAGARLLLDTSLGEGSTRTPFITDRRSILAETLVDRNSPDRFWVSRNDRLALMGSTGGTGNPGAPESPPDQLHFANWKRLNEAPWKITAQPGRNFNYMPYSIGDSAVCYYFEPAPLARGASRDCSLLLAAEDAQGFAAWRPASGEEYRAAELPAEPVILTPVNDKAADLRLLDELISRLDKYMSGELSFSDDEAAAMEAAIKRLRARYGLF